MLNYILSFLSIHVFEKYFYFRKHVARVPIYPVEINLKALDLKYLDKKSVLYLHPLDKGFSKDFLICRFREPLNTYMIYSLVKREKPAVLDIGSNLGYFILIELLAGAKSVVAVEPNPLIFPILVRNIKGFPNVIPINAAISDKRGESLLLVRESFNFSSLTDSSIHSRLNAVKEVKVKTMRLSDVAEIYTYSMIRMDVEGHEYKILRDTIPDDVKTIVFELHIHPPYKKSHAVHLLRHLYDAGFTSISYTRDFPFCWNFIINKLGLKRTLNIIRKAGWKDVDLLVEVDITDLIKEIREIDGMHIYLRRA